MMGSVIASCGHELTEDEGLGATVATRGWTRECTRAVDYQTLCAKCLEWYRENNALLTPEQAEQWLSWDGRAAAEGSADETGEAKIGAGSKRNLPECRLSRAVVRDRGRILGRPI